MKEKEQNDKKKQPQTKCNSPVTHFDSIRGRRYVYNYLNYNIYYIHIYICFYPKKKARREREREKEHTTFGIKNIDSFDLIITAAQMFVSKYITNSYENAVHSVLCTGKRKRRPIIYGLVIL